MQKTAYEMRISDWSSDVCSSDLLCNDILIPGREVGLTGYAERMLGHLSCFLSGGVGENPDYFFLASSAFNAAISTLSAAISASLALLPAAPGMKAPAACWNISILRRVSSASGLFDPSAPSNAARTSCWFLRNRSEENTR